MNAMVVYVGAIGSSRLLSWLLTAVTFPNETAGGVLKVTTKPKLSPGGNTVGGPTKLIVTRLLAAADVILKSVDLIAPVAELTITLPTGLMVGPQG